MKKNLFFLAILLFVGGTFFTSCEKEEELSSKKEIIGFVFESHKNAQLERNVIGTISENEVVAEVPFGTDKSILVPSIEVSPKATVDPAGGVSTDFSNPKTYTVTAEDGSSKQFTVNVPVAPAPYIGSWETETSVNIDGLGLTRVGLEITESGGITMELKSTLTGLLFGQSIKGTFEPNSACNTEILLNQTQRWLDDKWTDETDQRCIMYYCSDSKMEFKYCKNYPLDIWWFTIEMIKKQ
jgi:hypothetical protein